MAKELLHKGVIFVCDNCGKDHTCSTYVKHGHIDFEFDGMHLPYKMKGTEGEFCNETCATVFIVKSMNGGKQCKS